jgi:hypothetical protein
MISQGLAVLFISAGAILDSSGYLALEIYFIVFLSAALATSMALWLVDALAGKYASMVPLVFHFPATPLLCVSVDERNINLRKSQ